MSGAVFTRMKFKLKMNKREIKEKLIIKGGKANWGFSRTERD
jgi:hypothetical protein